MIIEIKEDIFRGDDFKGLNFIIQVATHRQRYNLFVDLTKARQHALFRRQDFQDQELLEAYFNDYIISGKEVKRHYYITGSPKTRNQFTIQEGLEFLNQPLWIILENSLNDSYFIHSIIDNFDQSRSLPKHLENNWIQFANGGGCGNIVNVIKAKLSSYKSLPKPSSTYLRCFVLLDSDRQSPEEDLEYKHDSLIRYLKENGISYHVLEKRTMENYMPDEVFESFTAVRIKPWVHAYRHLTEVQKDFLNLSSGFSKKDAEGRSLVKREDQHQRIKSLYGGVSDANYDILDKGIPLADFKTNFPKNFQETRYVHKKTMQKRINHQQDEKEFDSIIAKLINLL